MIHEFHLSPPGTGRGRSCDANGAFVGHIPLLKRSIIDGRERWGARECAELSKEIGGNFGLPIDMSSKMGGVRAIANALNEGNVARAQIATVLLGIPDPPALSKGVDNRAELIKFIHDLHRSRLLKADWDPDEHPRWPVGAPDSQGGQFAPKGDGSATGQSAGETATSHQSPTATLDAGIPASRQRYDFGAPSNIQPALQSNNEDLTSPAGSGQGSANGPSAEDPGIYASYGRHIGDVQVASTATIALDVPLVGEAQAANWANLTRLATGVLRLGSGQIITAATLLAALDVQRERAAVDAAINKFGLSPANAADILAARAYVWAKSFAPMNFKVEYSEPQLEFASQSIMALELARPGTAYLASLGDKASTDLMRVAVKVGIENGAIFESRARPTNMPAALQTTSEAARASLGLQTNDRMQAHHLIPVNVWAQSPIAMLAKAGGWQPNSPTNLIALPADAATQMKRAPNLPIHNSNHPDYDGTAIGQIFEECERYGDTLDALTPAQARAIFEAAAAEMRHRIVAKHQWWPRLY